MDEMRTRVGLGRILTALAAALAGVLLAAAAQRCTPAAHPGEQVPVALNLLVSLDGDSLREEYVRRRLEAFERAHPDMRVHATYVESDTLVFLKLLYAGSDYNYDVVCMGDDAMLSAAEQKLVYPLDELFMGSLGLSWLDAVPDGCLKNTAFSGQIYGLPFIKSRLRVYVRGSEETDGGTVSLEELLDAAAGGSVPGSAWMPPGIAGAPAFLGMPAEVILRDLLLTSRDSGWSALTGEAEQYQVNTPEQVKLLQKLKAGLVSGAVENRDREALIRDFKEGRVNAVILEGIYGRDLAAEVDFPVGSAELWRTEDVPWIYQGCNLYLANRGVPHDYGPAWELVEFLIEGEALDQRTGRENDMEYKRVLSRKNTKAYLIVDRMIAEFLHGDEAAEQLLEGLQGQLDTALGE